MTTQSIFNHIVIQIKIFKKTIITSLILHSSLLCCYKNSSNFESINQLTLYFFLINARINWKENWEGFVRGTRMWWKKALVWFRFFIQLHHVRIAREFKRLCKCRIKMHSIKIFDYSAKDDTKKESWRFYIYACGLLSHLLIRCL